MKPFIVKCPVENINIIVPLHDSVVVPPGGTIIFHECPCCHGSHEMRLRDAKTVKRAS